MDATDLLGRPAAEIAAAVRGGAVAASDVVDAHLRRVAALDRGVGAFVAVRAAEARAEAAALDARGDLAELPLAGVPVAVKDVFGVAGLPTGHGSRALSRTPETEDHVVVARLRSAGAVVVGVTRCPELSVFPSSDDADGAARNPWDATRVAGGSSGGSAAAVAAGMVPVALGSDGLGSIRIPAAACGLVGVKPGSGVVPVDLFGRDEHWFGMTQFGPLATTVHDAALVLDAIADGPPRFAAGALPERALRVAVSTAVPARGVRLGREQRDAVWATARVLAAAGHRVAEVDPPYDDVTALDVVTRWTAGTRRDAHDLGADLTALQPRTRAHLAAGRVLGRVRGTGEEHARRWRDRVDGFLDGVDVLLTPAMATAPPTGHGWHARGWFENVRMGLEWVPFASPWNLADLPAAVLPAGRDLRGLPLSVQLVAPRGDERGLLAVLRVLEAAAPWPRTTAQAAG